MLAGSLPTGRSMAFSFAVIRNCFRVCRGLTAAVIVAAGCESMSQASPEPASEGPKPSRSAGRQAWEDDDDDVSSYMHQLLANPTLQVTGAISLIALGSFALAKSRVWKG